MIIFHEGLPRSGKSFEAVKTRIIPALRSGRKVFAYVEGLNHQGFAEHLELPLERIQELLIQLTAEHVPTIYEHVDDDSLVVIDELQDFFPASKNPLTPDMTKFVTQHGHRGLDIVVMGQDHRDCHMLWKRRIDQLITFVKRDAIGRVGEYTWTTFKNNKGKFEKLNSGKGIYDSRFFGLYLSHEPTVMNKETYQDDRANVLKSPFFTKVLPVFGLVLAFAIYHLIGYFSKKPETSQTDTKAMEQPVKTEPESAPSVPANAPNAPALPPTIESNYLEEKLTKYRPRLAAIIESKDQNRMVASIELIDSENRVQERFNIPQVIAFGFMVVRKPYGLMLTRGTKQFIVTSFPVTVTKSLLPTTEAGIAKIF